MIMADILKIFLIIVGVLTVFVSYWLVAEALFPGIVERSQTQYAHPVKITLLGLAIAVLPVFIGGAVSKLPNPALKITGLTLLVIPALLGLVGSAGLTRKIGAGLPSPLDLPQPWRRVLRGGVLLALTFLLPFVGWIVLPIWTIISGLGAFVLSARQSRHASAKPTLPLHLTSAPGTAG